MNWTEFLDRYQATELALQAYVETLPLWVNIWRGWMFFIFTAGILFVIWKTEARWMALVMFVSIQAYTLVAMATGVGRLPSIAFVLFWAPLVYYFAKRLSKLASTSWFDRVYAVWFKAALVTLCVSLIFDVYNVLFAVLASD